LQTLALDVFSCHGPSIDVYNNDNTEMNKLHTCMLGCKVYSVMNYNIQKTGDSESTRLDLLIFVKTRNNNLDIMSKFFFSKFTTKDKTWFSLVRFNSTMNTLSFWCQGCVQTDVLSGNHKTKSADLFRLL